MKTIVRLPEPVEDGIEDVLDSVQDVESEENEHQFEQLVHVGKLQNVCHKWLPDRDARTPQYRYDGGDTEVAKRVFANVFFVGCGLLLDEFTELQDGQKKPAPDEVICHPIGSLLAHDVDHTGDHHHIITHLRNDDNGVSCCLCRFIPFLTPCDVLKNFYNIFQKGLIFFWHSAIIIPGIKLAERSGIECTLKDTLKKP